MLAQGTQVLGEVHRREPGEGMIIAEHSAGAGQSVLIELTGLSVATNLMEVSGEIVR